MNSHMVPPSVHITLQTAAAVRTGERETTMQNYAHPTKRLWDILPMDIYKGFEYIFGMGSWSNLFDLGRFWSVLSDAIRLCSILVGFISFVDLGRFWWIKINFNYGQLGRIWIFFGRIGPIFQQVCQIFFSLVASIRSFSVDFFVFRQFWTDFG